MRSLFNKLGSKKSSERAAGPDTGPQSPQTLSANPKFEHGTQNWYGLGCQLDLIPAQGGSGAMVARAFGRQDTWQGLAQDLGPVLEAGQAYCVLADVTVAGCTSPVSVRATVAATWRGASGKDQTNYVTAGSVSATPGQWGRIDSVFTLPEVDCPEIQSRMYLEGPGAGVDIMALQFALLPLVLPTVNPVQLRAPPAALDEGTNIVANGSFARGAESWSKMAGTETFLAFPACAHGTPEGPPAGASMLPPLWPTNIVSQRRKEALNARSNSALNLASGSAQSGISQGISGSGPGGPGGGAGPCGPPYGQLAGPTGAYLLITGRRDRWHGPCQDLGQRVKVKQTYAVSAWVRICQEGSWKPAGGKEKPNGAQLMGGEGGPPPEVNLCLSVDGQWVNCGAVEASWKEWVRVWGSFRLEQPYKIAKLYAQGPGSGVDILLADVRAVEVDWKKRVAELKAQTDQVRKCDVTLSVKSASGVPAAGAQIRVMQVKRSFPIGSCINAGSFPDPSYQRYFLDHFNIAVFENELKWTHIEEVRGYPKFQQADEMVAWAKRHGVALRMHCLFWDNAVPSWAKQLPAQDILGVIDQRIQSVTARYEGDFIHYDVNNEMLHGGYFEETHGVGTVVRMFQVAHSLDPTALLFLNDYHTDDGMCSRARPENYCQQARHLLALGAPVQGLGVQGHITAPVGAHLRHAFDMLASTGLPICITELDVESADDNLRADDLEIYLREAYAHEAVQGVLLWGFWEGAMYRKNAHLVNKDWTLNAAGRRLRTLLDEWTTPPVQGTCNAVGELAFRGFPGEYEVSVELNGKSHRQVVRVHEHGTVCVAMP